MTDRGQRVVADGAQELVRDLRDDARAVAGARIGAHRTAVLEVAERVQGQGDDVVAGRAAQSRDHGEATGVAFLCGVVQALRLRNKTEPGKGRLLRHKTVLTK